MIAQNSANTISTLTKAQNILLVTHENPDGDALASLGAMYGFLSDGKKNIVIFCKDIPPKNFDFIPHVEQCQTDKANLNWICLDVVVVLDCANIKRTGLADEITDSNCVIINIDHHVSNDKFGDINFVQEDAVSTTQILYDIFTEQKIAINKDMANCILTGILTDSGNFAYATSNSHTFTIASEMLIRGANVRDILNYTSKNKKLYTLKAWGLALSRLTYNKNYDVVYTVLTQSDLKNFGIGTDDLEGLSNFLNTLKDAKIIMVLYELSDGRIKGSLRTTRHDVDVSKIAMCLGGGGHKKAAGFEIKGQLRQTDAGWEVF